VSAASFRRPAPFIRADLVSGRDRHARRRARAHPTPARGRTGAYVEDPERLSVAEFLAKWLAHVRHRGLAGRTLDRYETIIGKYLSPAIGAHKLAQLRPVHISDYYAQELTRGRRRHYGAAKPASGVSPATVRRYHRILNQASKHAVRQQLLTRNPADAVDPPRSIRREMNVLDHTQGAQLIHAAEGTELHMPIFLGLATGMRRGEILGLRWKDLDLEAAVLSVAQSAEQTKAGVRMKQPKTSRSRRTIDLPAVVVEALRRHKTAQAEERLRAGPARRDHGLIGLVFTMPDGTPHRPDHLTRKFTGLVKKLGLPVRFHDLRHSHITHLLQAGVHPKVAADRASHSSVSITLDVYSHTVQGLQQEAAGRIDAAMRQALGEPSKNNSA
jgi:integrase